MVNKTDSGYPDELYANLYHSRQNLDLYGSSVCSLRKHIVALDIRQPAMPNGVVHLLKGPVLLDSEDSKINTSTFCWLQQNTFKIYMSAWLIYSVYPKYVCWCFFPKYFLPKCCKSEMNTRPWNFCGAIISGLLQLYFSIDYFNIKHLRFGLRPWYKGLTIKHLFFWNHIPGGWFLFCSGSELSCKHP